MRRFFSLIVLSVLIVPVDSVTAEEKPGGSETIEMFNGEDLSGWSGREDLWSVEDGAITGTTSADQPLEHNTFLIWDEQQPGDFELHCLFKIEGGNSGIQYRSKIIDKEKFIVGGYQADIDAALHYAGINYEERGRGILALRGQRVTLKANEEKVVETFGDAAEIGKVIKSGEWNRYRIVAKGKSLQHYINDSLTCEVIDENDDKRANEGVIALQIHVGPPMKIQFKDFKLKMLK